MGEPSYSDLRSAVDGAGCDWGVAETHGTLCGLVCGAGSAGVDAWRTRFAAASMRGQTDDVDDTLARVGASAAACLGGTSFKFAPLLPDDETALAVRTDELAEWCQGFLAGCAMAGLNRLDNLGDDVSEVVADLSELTRAQFADDQPREEAENAYAELVEFVRVGVQLVYEELAALRGSPGDPIGKDDKR